MTDEELKTSEQNDPQQPPASPDRDERPGFFYRRGGRIFVASLVGLVALGMFTFAYFYMRFGRMIDARLAAGPFSGSINIFTAPRTVAVGDAVTLEDVVSRLKRNGYTTARGNTVGWYNVRGEKVEIFPGRDAYQAGEPGVLEFSKGKISRIVSLTDNTERPQYSLDPQLIANLSQNREKRRLVHFADIPPVLVHAVVSVEDKHFFHHTGFDVFRIMKAAYIDMKEGRKEQGASTLSMQLARGLWLEPDKRWKRKAEELLITMHLEHKLTKQQIFEDYANQVYLGRRGTFSINGFGEGARAFFGKDLSQITLPEAATLAGLVQRPSYFNPYRYPDRIKERRDVVLVLMRDNGYITDAEYKQAVDAPVKVTPEQSEGMESQYFVDLMNDELQSKLGDRDTPARYIYTTLDPDLQQAADEAVRIGMQGVDEQLHKRKKHDPIPEGQPQVALIAIDPHTGEIKALVGGRNYGNSQLNHAVAMRQPGSAFKPFVYAAALSTAVEGGSKIFTPATVVDDTPTTFKFGRVNYQPGNFKHEFMGTVTLRTALAHSLNVAAVSVAQQVGYDKVVQMARRAGLNEDIKATPAVALGAYETTPLEIAGAYTLFANQGMHVTPATVSLIRAADDTVLYQHQADARPALDTRVAYLMVSMLQEVLRSGTGASVRSRGFTLPAAGKTGTSHDGWFAGFTSELLCVVWVGFDDNRELNLEGAHSALPIWTEFMKRASKFREYRDAKPFKAPPGVLSVDICADSGQLAGPYCPHTRSDVFIDGSQPVITCEMHNPAVGYADRGADWQPAVTSGSSTVPPATAYSGTNPRPLNSAPVSATNPNTTVPPAPAAAPRPRASIIPNTLPPRPASPIAPNDLPIKH